MKIPQVRAELLEIAIELDNWGMPHQAWHVRYLVSEMWRRPSKRKAPAKPNPGIPRGVTQAYAATHPTASYMEIANALGHANTGRVSEHIAGKRK